MPVLQRNFFCIVDSGRMSISPTFYVRLFYMKVLSKAFLYIHFRSELLLAKEYWHKCAYKMLVKLITGHIFFSEES
jgi:hypothetical protein